MIKPVNITGNDLSQQSIKGSNNSVIRTRVIERYYPTEWKRKQLELQAAKWKKQKKFLWKTFFALSGILLGIWGLGKLSANSYKRNVYDKFLPKGKIEDFDNLFDSYSGQITKTKQGELVLRPIACGNPPKTGPNLAFAFSAYNRPDMIIQDRDIADKSKKDERRLHLTPVLDKKSSKIELSKDIGSTPRIVGLPIAVDRDGNTRWLAGGFHTGFTVIGHGIRKLFGRRSALEGWGGRSASPHYAYEPSLRGGCSSCYDPWLWWYPWLFWGNGWGYGGYGRYGSYDPLQDGYIKESIIETHGMPSIGEGVSGDFGSWASGISSTIDSINSSLKN